MNVKQHGSQMGFFSFDSDPPTVKCCDCGETIESWGERSPVADQECIPTKPAD